MKSARPLPIPLHALLTRGRPDAWPVCLDRRGFLRWREFAGRVAGLAGALAKRREKRWLLVGDDAAQFAVACLALLQAGKDVVIPPNTQPGTLLGLAGAFEARVDEITALDDPCTGCAAIDPHAARIALYTSGSSGRYKCIVKTLAQLEAEVEALEAMWGAALGAAVIVATAPQQHIYGLLFRILWPLYAGRIFDAVTCAHPDTLEERLAAAGTAALVSSPAQLTRLPELLSLSALSSLKSRLALIFSSGGPLPAGAAHALAEAWGEAPIEIFGSTETGGVAWRRQNVGSDAAWTPFPTHRVERSPSGALILHSPFLPDGRAWTMDDGIEIMAGGRFRLLGRLDRTVKIEEKRLSLPDMEAHLAAHAWIEAAAVVPLSGRRQSLGVAAQLTAAGREATRTAGRRAVTQALRGHLADYFDAVLLPRRWRFPDRLPVDARGKLTQAALAALFDDAPLLPEVLGVRVAENGAAQLVLDLHVPLDLAHFPGHFPAMAILPGIVQVDWAVRFARRHLPLRGAFSALENLKFLAVVRPGARLELSLAWDGEGRQLDFSYVAAERKYSAGRIVFGGDE